MVLMVRTPFLINAALSTLPRAPDPWIILRSSWGWGDAVGGGGGGGGGAGAGGEGAHAIGGGLDRCAGEDGGRAVGGGKGRGHQLVRGQGGGRKTLAEDAAGARRGGHGGRNKVSVKDTKGGERVNVKDKINYNPRIHLALQSEVPPSAPWKHAWEMNPLVLHDRQLVVAMGHAAKPNEGGAMEAAAAAVPADADDFFDLSGQMTAILGSHPGPVSTFRVDSTKWTDDIVLQNWVQMLSDKSAKDVTMLNLGNKTSAVFPIEDMRSPKLSALRLGFMAVPHLDLLCFNYSSLQVLFLFSCSFSGLKLSWVITDCPCLKNLHIGFCSENVKIDSNTIELVAMWGCKANWLVIESAPKLTFLTTSIMPRGNENAKVQPQRFSPEISISLNNVPSLRTINYILLPYHSVTVNGIPIMKECTLWKSLESLKVGLNMSNRSQRDDLRKLLESLPMLIELCVLRLDKVNRDEGFEVVIDCPFEDLNHSACVTKRLRNLTIEGFRGGPAELHLIQSVLRHAPRLLELCTISCLASPQKRIGQAALEIESYGKLSKECQVTHLCL